ncbi:MAG TPA: hypothetical protein PK948_03215 [Gemmatimonadales bacterium]|nr:hypothetical protein [Gemmatimonadales bacterium]
MIGKCASAVLLVAGALATPARAQMGEAHFGAIGSFGTGSAYQWGAGLTASYAPGRLAYMGLRWIYYAGSTDRRADSTGSWDVTTRAQLFGADLGLEYPLGAVELVGSVTMGAMRFWQGADQLGVSGVVPLEEVGTSFVLAPTVMVEFRTGPLVMMPQVAYYFAGSPDFRWPVGHDGWALSLMIVLPLETHRITY